MRQKKQHVIDREFYKIPEYNFYQIKHDKSLIILGSTNRKDGFYLKRTQNKENGKTKTWNTYTITRSGDIYEHYNPVFYTDFTGDPLIDKKSVSILLENMGHLSYDEDMNVYYNDLNEKLEDPENLYIKEWRGHKYYEKYTRNQYNATVFLCRSLCLELNINDDSYGHNAYEENTINYNGIISRSNMDINQMDLNPSFDFRKFLKDLKK